MSYPSGKEVRSSESERSRQEIQITQVHCRGKLEPKCGSGMSGFTDETTFELRGTNKSPYAQRTSRATSRGEVEGKDQGSKIQASKARKTQTTTKIKRRDWRRSPKDVENIADDSATCIVQITP
jgi:hypothetical protein